MNPKELIRTTTLLLVIGVHTTLSDGAARWRYLDTKGVVCLGSWMTILGAFYLWCLNMACPRAAMKKPPPLTADTVYVYVYGMGFMLFVAVYCGLGCSLSATCAFTAGVGGVCVDDILALKSESRWRRAAWWVCVLLSVVAAAISLLDLDQFLPFWSQVDAGNLFAITYGVMLPLGVPFLFHLVRAQPPTAESATSLHSPRVGPAVIIELLHFGMPLTVILATIGAFALNPTHPKATPHYDGLGNLTFDRVITDATGVETGWGARDAWFMALLPITTGAWLFFLVQSFILYRTTEFLVMWVLAGAVRHCAHNLTALPAQVACVLAFKAFLITLALGQSAPAHLIRLQQTAEYPDEDDGNGTVLLFETSPPTVP